MDANQFAEEICVLAFGWHWGIDHDTLYDSTIELLRREREGIYKSTDPIRLLDQAPLPIKR